MKQLLLTLALVLTFCTATVAQTATTTTDSVTATTDTTSMTSVQNSLDNEDDATDNIDSDFSSFNAFQDMGKHVLIPIIAILAVFGMPVFIILIVFIYRHKTKKAQYQLAERALAVGKEIPEGLFKEPLLDESNIQTKGIKNVFLGIGLGIFLWAFLGFEFGCIGFLIMFMGIGQIIIYRTQQPSVKKDDFIHHNNEVKKETIATDSSIKEDEKKLTE